MLSHRPRILIADEQNLFAELCKTLLEPEFQIVGIVDNGHAAVRAAIRLVPDLILIDVALPMLNGLEACAQVKRIVPAVKIMFLTMNRDLETIAGSFQRGGSGYVLKMCTSSELLVAVRRVLQGHIYISETLPKDDINYRRRQHRGWRDSDAHLTVRQREVLQLLAEGKVMKEIGNILSVKTRTVAFHKYRLMETLGATSNADLVRYAVQHGIVN